MPDDAHVHPKVHLNVHLPANPEDGLADGKLGRGMSPRSTCRKGARRPFLHCRDGYWFFQRRWPKPLDPSGSAAPLRVALGRVSEPEARRSALALELETGTFFESLTSCTIQDLWSSGEVAMPYARLVSDTPAEFSSRYGRVIAVKVHGKLPSSGSPTDEDERLTLAGLRATKLIMKDIASARNGSYVERAALTMIDSIWDAHAVATAQRQAAASAFRAFAAQLTGPGRLPSQTDASSLLTLPAAPEVDPAPQSTSSATPPAPRRIENAAPPAPRVEAIPSQSDQGCSSVNASGGSEHARQLHPVAEPAGEPAVQILQESPCDPTTLDDGDPRMLFSEGVRRHIQARKAQNRNFHESSVAYPGSLWIALMGDLPMGAYPRGALQDFINLVSNLPPNASKIEAFKELTFKQMIEANKASGFAFGSPALKTVRETWVASIQGVFSQHFVDALDGPPLRTKKLRYPTHLDPVEPHAPPPLKVTNEAFRLAVERGAFEDAILALLARTTGRRIGLLAHLRGVDFRRDAEGALKAQVPTRITTENGVRFSPYKNKESTEPFVIPSYVLSTGFDAWVADLGSRFLFPRLMKAKDPADAASKRLNRLVDAAAANLGLDQREAGDPHGWRASVHDDLDDAKVVDAAARRQVGHAAQDVHERYKARSLTEAQAQALFTVPAPSGLDLSPFKRIDWSQA